MDRQRREREEDGEQEKRENIIKKKGFRKGKIKKHTASEKLYPQKHEYANSKRQKKKSL